MFSLKRTKFFRDKSKFCLFYFLSHDKSAFASTVLMFALGGVIHFFNLMIYDAINENLIYISYIFGMCTIISMIFFLCGIVLKKITFIRQINFGLAIYLIFSFVSFCCNFITIIFSNTFSYWYDLGFFYYWDYLEQHPDTEKTNKEIRSCILHTLYIKLIDDKEVDLAERVSLINEVNVKKSNNTMWECSSRVSNTNSGSSLEIITR
ncbi:hypothetical protein BCR32DRAFT_274090 [Anaeromyces robustus]|uniref:Uncharacterized protein n=1 Tax=Anaeromyces robustus TaxID=1754192 RepID=A0A1Y1XQ63_9FUNG|nr:hypothetical protein BCR32DRAFT_274090 [Anaeromyces robustus]|eukprot:ORX87882.1 hypothetical protein BCR32DRAFT_274090 [Anaeromyces robustus]